MLQRPPDLEDPGEPDPPQIDDLPPAKKSKDTTPKVARLPEPEELQTEVESDDDRTYNGTNEEIDKGIDKGIDERTYEYEVKGTEGTQDYSPMAQKTRSSSKSKGEAELIDMFGGLGIEKSKPELEYFGVPWKDSNSNRRETFLLRIDGAMDRKVRVVKSGTAIKIQLARSALYVKPEKSFQDMVGYHMSKEKDKVDLTRDNNFVALAGACKSVLKKKIVDGNRGLSSYQHG